MSHEILQIKMMFWNLLLFCKVIWFQKAYVNLAAFNFDYFQWKIISWHLVVNWGFLFWFLIFWQCICQSFCFSQQYLNKTGENTWNVFFSPTNQYTSKKEWRINQSNTVLLDNGISQKLRLLTDLLDYPAFGFTLLAILQQQIIKILRDNTS